MTPVLEPPVLLCPSWNAAICFANPPATVYLMFRVFGSQQGGRKGLLQGQEGPLQALRPPSSPDHPDLATSLPEHFIFVANKSLVLL